MENKTIIYIGIAAVAYYLYTKSQEFKFTAAETQAINAIAKGNPILVIRAVKTVLTPERYAFMERYTKNNASKILEAMK
jgi:hypothetical protein